MRQKGHQTQCQAFNHDSLNWLARNVRRVKQKRRQFNDIKIDCPYKGSTSSKINSYATEDDCRVEKNRSVNVRMGEIEIRTYPVILGDHPDCSSGPPVTIAWEYSKRQVMNIDDFESNHSRRSGTELVMSYYDRKRLVRHYSRYTDQEINEAINEVNRVKRQREWTKKMLRFSRIEEAMGIVQRSLVQKRKRGRWTTLHDIFFCNLKALNRSIVQ